MVVCAWFVVGIRQAHGIDQATSLLSGATPLTAGQAAHVRSLLDQAHTLNPDRAVDVLRARLALAQGDSAAARRILFGVIHSEPKYLDAWIWYARASTGNPVAFFAAQIGIRRLIRQFPRPR